MIFLQATADGSIGRSYRAHMGVSQRPGGANCVLFRIVSAALVEAIKVANVMKIEVWASLYLVHFHYIKCSRLPHLPYLYTIN